MFHLQGTGCSPHILQVRYLIVLAQRPWATQSCLAVLALGHLGGCEDANRWGHAPFLSIQRVSMSYLFPRTQAGTGSVIVHKCGVQKLTEAIVDLDFLRFGHSR